MNKENFTSSNMACLSFPRWLAMSCLLTPTAISAQSVTIDTEPAHVEYYRIPDNPLPATYTTYTADIDIDFSDLAKSGYSKSTLVDTYLKLDGYKKVLSNEDVKITANIGEFIAWSEARNTSRSKTKDKQGNEIEKISYYIEFKYSIPMSIVVMNKEAKTLLDDYIFTMSDTRTWTSPYYNSLSELESYWSGQRSNRITELQKDLIKEGMQKMYEMLNNQFGYRLMKENARFETIGKKKHPEYSKFQKNIETLQAAFKLMTADKELDVVKTKAEPALTFYNTSAAKYKTGNKDSEKLKHICLYNQALAYFWLEDFDQAESNAKAIQKFDAKDKDAKKLLEEIQYVKSSLENADRTTRHQIVIGGKT